MFWDEGAETMPGRDLKILQEKRLKDIVKFTYENSCFYRERFEGIGLKPNDIKTLEDLEKIPFTTKEDLRNNYPSGMLSVPRSKLIRFHASSGTTGKPTVVGYTRKDIETWADLMARVLTSTGLTSDDTVQLIYNYAFFTGGLGFHYGAERVGASVIPSGVGNSKKQLMTMRDLEVTAFSSTPSYALYLAEYAEEEGIDIGEFKVDKGVFGAESWSEGIRKRIERAYGMLAYDNYGLSELCGPGVAVECEEKDGMHVWSDHFIVEVINPDTGEVLDEGEEGELVFTTLTREAMPLLRYRTRDVSLIYPESKCPCGRTHPRIARLRGRSDDMIVIRGVNVFPSQVEHVLLGVDGVAEHYQIIVDREGVLDSLDVNVEVTENIFKGEAEGLIELKSKIESELKSALDVKAKVHMVEPGSIPRSLGKAKRVLDLRKEL